MQKCENEKMFFFKIDLCTKDVPLTISHLTSFRAFHVELLRSDSWVALFPDVPANLHVPDWNDADLCRTFHNFACIDIDQLEESVRIYFCLVGDRSALRAGRLI